MRREPLVSESLDTKKINELSYVPPHLAIEAMRDNGYRNTAFAIAELIDNSIQADARNVELLCAEKEVQHSTRRAMRVEEIAILDDGVGMTEEVLKMSLQFGNGTRLSRDKRTGIGRFGMGLPASSISQCKRVDVWSWTNGVENAMHIYLDVEEIKSGKSSIMPTPDSTPVPQIWRDTGKVFRNSGTLVVWSNLDRLMWSKGKTIIDNSELLIGRMYRKFLSKEALKIRLAVFDIEKTFSSGFSIDKLALPNDPCYLIDKTSCPEPFDKEAMFQPLGGWESYEAKYTVEYGGQLHDIFIRMSYAKDAARISNNAGALPHGKHAQKNIGVSVVRAERELEMDQTLVLQYDPTERWWGIEVEFPPSLDEAMGVTNNKQSARNFSEILDISRNVEEMMKRSKKTFDEIKTELEEESDPRAPLLEIGVFIDRQLTTIRELLNQQTKGIRTKEESKRHIEIDRSPEKKATEITIERKERGFSGESDRGDTKPAEERQEDIKTDLIEFGVEPEVAERLAVRTVSNNLKYTFAKSPFESDAFFSVTPRGGNINIVLNTRHEAYTHLLEVLEKNEFDESEPSKLKERLEKASDGLRLLLMAWARYEDELPAGSKEFARETRQDWGRISKRFLREADC